MCTIRKSARNRALFLIYCIGMKLTKIVLHGFKSFADQTVFEFPQQFIAIVGPNGSGKSNVSDAIRWVLGEQSVKSLRGKQTTDLIFSGSEKLSRMNMASVELHLDNADGAFPLEYEEVVISRKLFRSGESEYRINGSQVRLQDIVMMLAQAKFGQKSYAVIGQGMITSFLNATPQERKAFFDEATGVKEFQIKRDKAINKLIRTEENLIQSEGLVAEIEPHLKSLERLVKRLEKREGLETELGEVQVEYYGSTWKQLQHERESLGAERATIEQSIAAHESELNRLQKESDALASSSSRNERYEQLQHQFNQLLERKSQLLKEQAVLKGKLEVEHERQGKLSLVWLERKEDELVAEHRSIEGQRRGLTEQLKSDELELKRAEQRATALRGDIREEQEAIAQVRTRITEETHAMTIPEVQQELAQLFHEQEDFLRSLLNTSDLDSFKAVQKQGKRFGAKFAEFMDRLTTSEKESVEALRVELRQKEQAVDQIQADLDQTQETITELRVAIGTAQSGLESSSARVQAINSQLEEVRKEIADATAESDSKNADDQTAAYNQQLLQFEQQIADIDTQIAALRGDIDAFNQDEEEKKIQLVTLQGQMRSVQRKLDAGHRQSNTIDVQAARIETRQEDIKSELQRDIPEALHAPILNYTGELASGQRHDELERKMLSLQRQLEAIGNVDQETVEEYASTKERFEFLSTQIQDLDATIGSLEKVIDELDATIHTQFQKNFKKINASFQDYFGVLFEGGSAKLDLLTEKPEEQHPTPENEEEAEGESMHEEKERELLGKRKKKQKVIAGIDVIAHPPRKKVATIAALSGGEKSLVAVSLLCAIIANNPSPFVVLDEVEAALDEENSEKLAAILRDLSTKTQIITITHNRVTMRAADMLYGVTVGSEGKSHILSVELTEAEEMVEA